VAAMRLPLNILAANGDVALSPVVDLLHRSRSWGGFRNSGQSLECDKDHTVRIRQCGRITNAHGDGCQMAGL
jgi:hypothetical protein